MSIYARAESVTTMVNSIMSNDTLSINGQEIYGTIYINIYDSATGQPTDGNNVEVTYTEYPNGVAGSVYQVYIPGQSQAVYTGLLQRMTYDGSNDFEYHIVINSLDTSASAPVTFSCDAQINSVTINKKESGVGSADAQITINATSSHLPIQYSLDNATWQSSATFTGLSGGSKTAYIKDAGGCSAIYSFTIPTLAGLLVSDPSVNLGNNNYSRWNAAFNPITFTYQRKDFEVTNIYADSVTGNAAIQFNGVTSTIITYNNASSTATVVANDKVYLKAGAYNGVYNVTSTYGSNTIIIDQPYVSSITNTGFININKLRPYYKVKTEITYLDPITQNTQIVVAVHRPSSTGLVSADVSSFLQSLLSTKDNSDYSQVNFKDDNLSASYTVRYAETWDGHLEEFIAIATPFYLVYAAKQLGEKYAGNLAAYVPFKTLTDQTQLAKWITDFAEPAYSNGYPFDIGFIYGDDLAGLALYSELIPLDINRMALSGGTQTTYLLNEDGSFLYNEDGSRLVISRPITAPANLTEHIGLNRLLVNTVFPDNVYYFNLTIKYNDSTGTPIAVTQTQTVRVDHAVDENSIYLRWIGLSGSWNYYRFVYNQEVSLDVQDAVIIKNHVSDWENQQGIEEVISKTAGQKMKVMAEDLSVADIKGLQSIKYSPKVQMLLGTDPAKWQTVVINSATFTEYETLYGQYAFSITFNMPSINIQTQ